MKWFSRPPAFVPLPRYRGQGPDVRAHHCVGSCLEPVVPRACIVWIDTGLEPHVGDIVHVVPSNSLDFGLDEGAALLKRLLRVRGELVFGANDYVIRIAPATIVGVLVSVLPLPQLYDSDLTRRAVERNRQFVEQIREHVATR